MAPLDGVRGIAILAIMAFHSGVPGLDVGGYFGVDAFFVLSGFVITLILLREWDRTHAIRLGKFYAARARRLIPALLVMLIGVALYVAYVAPPGQYPGFRNDALSVLAYFSNWHFISIGANYFTRSAAPSLLTHTWSLAIEEQFYLVWPLVVLGLLKLTKNLRVLLAVCVLGALASAVEMAVLYHPGTDPTRLYYGTDTHAQCLLVGAALAVGLAMIAQRRRLRGTVPVSPRPTGGDPGWAATSHRIRVGLAIAGGAGAVATGVLWWRVSYTGSFLWRGGFLVAAASTAAVLACVVCSQRSWVATALSVAPLRYLGRISYGLYLWHFPLFQWIDGARTGLTGYSLFGIRFVVTLTVATASFYLVERPIRHGDLLRRWRAWVATPVAFAGVAAIVVATTAGSAAVAASAVPTAAPPAVSAKRPISVGLPLTPAAPPEAVLPGSTVVLLVGDSTAVTLGFGLAVDAKRYNATFIDGGIIECGVGQVTEMQTFGMIAPPGPHCRPSTPLSARWPALWATWIHKYHPGVVAILFGRWEVSNVEWHGQWTDISAPAFAAYVKQQLEQAVHIASSHGSL
ncbi:MAG TPA: acyltransferase, partial [Acidimicrobiales bacterium]|nr:acyltransferase [Acidimicrobiales bacterium]